MQVGHMRRGGAAFADTGQFQKLFPERATAPRPLGSAATGPPRPPLINAEALCRAPCDWR